MAAVRIRRWKRYRRLSRRRLLNLHHNEVLYWAGYVYRYWHFLTGESSKDIYKQAPAETMNTNYLMFHCMDTELAIEDLKEIHRQKVKKRSKSGRKAMSDMIQSD